MIQLISKIMVFVMLFELTVPVLKETGPSEAYAANWICGQDLNGDGYSDSKGEVMQCIVSAQGQFCPVGAVDCTAQVTPPICPAGSSLNTNTDKCEATPTISCTTGYTYDSSLDMCVQAATCPSNGVLNVNRDLCEIVLNDGSCPSGYTYDVILQACTQPISCPSGGTYNTVRDRCEIATTLACPSGYSFNNVSGKCEQAPTCPPGSTYSTTVDKCVQNAMIGCPAGYSYNAGTGKCEQSPFCPSPGSYNNANNRCELPATYNYVPQYQCSYNGAVYGDPSTCSGNCYNWAYCTQSCWQNCTTATYYYLYPCAPTNCGLPASSIVPYGASGSACTWGICPPFAVAVNSLPSGSFYVGRFWDDANMQYTYFYQYDQTTCTTQCSSWSCPLGGYGCQGGGTPYCVAYYGCSNISYGYYSCPGGYTVSGSTCIANPTCGSGGGLNGTTDKCEIAPSFTCPSGFTYDSGTGKCVASATCSSGGVLNTAADVCQLSQINDCPSGYTYDAGNNICQSAVVCSPGAFDGTIDKCKVVASNLCPSGYTFNPTSGKCEKAPVCASGSTYSNAADKCTAGANHQCPTNTTYSPTSRLCEAIPICSAGAYDPIVHGCNLGANICPLGNYACLPNAQEKNQCSPNPCIDTDVTKAQITKVDDTMLQNDAARDADGNCLGTIYLFTGRGMRCRPAGMTVGYINNCCKNKQSAVRDNMGTVKNLYTAYNVVKDIYHVGQIAYYGSQIINGGTVAVDALYATGQITGEVAQGITMVSQAGTLEAGFNSYLSTMINPATIAVTVIVTVAMEVLMGDGCDQKDLETALLRDSGMCHYVGDYCEEKWPFIGCVQKAKGFCCFNSKLGRIIHEQGRPQLVDFQPNGKWGDGPSPNCKGFTPEQFQMLDFGKMDLSEYFNEIQTKAVETIQQNVNDKIQKFYDNIR